MTARERVISRDARKEFGVRRIPVVVTMMLLVTAMLTSAVASAQTRIRAPYLDILWNYYDGNYQQAIDQIAAWPLDTLRERAFHDLDEGVIVGQGAPSITFMSEGQRVNTAKIWATLTPVAALLHVETGYQLLRKEQAKAGIQHLMLARLLADWTRWRFILEYLPTEGKDLQYGLLRRDVYLVIAWILQSAVDRNALQDHLEVARKNLPDEADVWLASGSAEELSADPLILRTLSPEAEVGARAARLEKADRSAPRDAWERWARERFLAEAEAYHREAIARDTTLAEAHVRLGRVLQQRGKLADARAELETARRLASGGHVGYLATLFLAGVVEESSAGTSEETRAGTPPFELYEELVKRWPECQSGHLGLSRAYSARGDGRAALEALAPLWKESDRRACADAWWSYWGGQAWRLDETLRALRDRVTA
jgi:tetratricopeptide (TPR) repeat protein